MQSNDDARLEQGSGRSDRESRGRARRQLVEQARKLAVEGKWEDALAVNQQLVERSPRDADAYNRLGKAFFELRRFRSAYEAYQTAYSIDPANVIAQRNISRIEPLKETDEEGVEVPERGPMRPNVFVEEVGKTYVDDLVNVASGSVLTELSSGDRLQLVIQGNAVSVEDQQGTFIGQLEPRLANKMVELLGLGNEYEVYVTSSTGMSVRVIIRETLKHPAMGSRLSFPRQGKVNIPRAYLRDTRLFRDEPDMLLGDDEDDDADADDADEFETTDSDDDDTEFIEEAGATIDEDEEDPI